MGKHIKYERRREAYQKRHVLYNERDDKRYMKSTYELNLLWCQKKKRRKKLIMIDVKESCESVCA